MSHDLVISTRSIRKALADQARIVRVPASSAARISKLKHIRIRKRAARTLAGLACGVALSGCATTQRGYDVSRQMDATEQAEYQARLKRAKAEDPDGIFRFTKNMLLYIAKDIWRLPMGYH